MLERVSINDACRAIDLIASGDEPEPRVYDQLPKAVRQISFRLRRNRQSGPIRQQQRIEPVRCPWCQDHGIVYVLAGNAQRVLRECWGSRLPADWLRWYEHDPEAEQARRAFGHNHRSTEATRPCFCEAGRPCDDGERFDPVQDCQFHRLYPEEVVRWFAEGPRVPKIEPDGRRVPVDQWSLWQPEGAF